MEIPNTELIKQAIQGDQDAFNKIGMQCRESLIQYCFGILKDYDLAEEAVQESLIRAFRHIANLKDPQSFSAWIQRIAHNCCQDILSKNNREVPEQDFNPVINGNIEDLLIDRATRHEFYTLLSNLSGSLRNVLLLYYVQGHPVKYIAQYLQIEEGAINKRLFDARTKLAEQIGKTNEDVEVMLSSLSKIRNGPLQAALTSFTESDEEYKIFEDGFEFGVNDAWESVAGVPSITNKKSHSGRYSYHIKDDHWDMMRVDLGHTMVGSASAWIYDDVTKPLAIMITANVTQGGAIDTNARLGIFEEWSPSHYYFQVDDFGESLRIPTIIPRSNGWHKFELVADGNLTQGYIDGAKVWETGLVPCFSHVYVGDGWEAEGAEGFVDDVKISYKPAFEN